MPSFLDPAELNQALDNLEISIEEDGPEGWQPRLIEIMRNAGFPLITKALEYDYYEEG